MPAFLVLAVLATAGLWWLLRRGGDGDAPARIARAATDRLPADRRGWGRAMVAELSQVDGRVQRWRFAAGVLRVALFPPSRNGNRTLAVAAAGLAVAAAATVAAAREVPGLSVFVAVLGLLLCGWATVRASRSPRPPGGVPALLVGLVGVAGVAAAVATVVRIAVAHPAATRDGSHVFSVLLACALAGYVALAAGRSRERGGVLWWGLAGALASGAGSVLVAVASPVTSAGVIGLVSPVGAAATLAVAVGAATTSGSRTAGVRAGVLATVLAAPIRVAVDLTALLQLHHYVLTDPYDVAAYPHSGYPDVASYLLSDAVAGEIITGLLLYPLTLVAVALLGAAAGARLRRATA